MKKLLCLVMALSLLTFTACSEQKSEKIKIGVVQIVSHTSLNTIRDSFAEQMKELGYTEENCEIEYENANNDTTVANSIIDSFEGDNKDLIVAITTPTALAAANVADEIPVVFSAVSNPVEVGLVDSLESTGRNITGVSDYVSVSAILDFAKQYSEVKKLGFLYNTGESNSVEILKQLKEAVGDEIEIIEGVATTTAEVQQAAEALCSKADAIFIPTDNTIASAMQVVTEITRENKVPVYASADSFVQDGALACVGITYEQVGQETANMVKLILSGEKQASEIPVKVFSDDKTIFINTTTAQEIEIDFSDIEKSDSTIKFE